MKKALLLGILAISCAGSALANISVNGLTFNTGNPALGAVYFDTVGGTPADSTVKVDFLFGATSGNLTDSSPVFTIQNGFSGFLNAGVINVTSSTVGGGAGFYQMRAWTGGATFADVANTKTGTSGVTAITFGGTPLAGGTALPVPDLNLHSSFAITSVAVPEPTTLALGLFGAAGLLIRRRK
ncbi:MAG: PEP-CTERM sorting domain-containing protein [Proteobacteria bacterium]|nr:PEP-CTERM sorting domain-containing protein [Verrucomicrobiota bacterium]NBU08310.1 PEP-CTERM sorting domain-containing protein [Pseudomonadota bacterium]